MHTRIALVATTFLTLTVPSVVHADTAIETETAQLGAQGQIGFSQSIEFERAVDGKAAGTLTQFEYGITDRAEILIEPFFQLWEFPNDEPSAHGFGDLEITPSYMFVVEHGARPALLAAFKLKVPTGDDAVGGSGKFDYYPYLMLGQHAGGWTFNANVGVNFATDPAGGASDKTVVWDLEAEHEVMGKLTGFAEVFSAEEGIPTVSGALEYQFTEHFNAFVASSIDTDESVVVRPGFNLAF